MTRSISQTYFNRINRSSPSSAAVAVDGASGTASAYYFAGTVHKAVFFMSGKAVDGVSEGFRRRRFTFDGMPLNGFKIADLTTRALRPASVQSLPLYIYVPIR